MLNADRDLVHALVSAWNTHDVTQIAPFYAPEYEGTDLGEAAPQLGPAGVSQSFARYWHAFPDLTFATDEVIMQDGRAAVMWTARGTHLGPLMHIPATNRHIEVRGVSILTLQNGAITRAFHLWDQAGLLRSMALLPEL